MNRTNSALSLLLAAVVAAGCGAPSETLPDPPPCPAPTPTPTISPNARSQSFMANRNYRLAIESGVTVIGDLHRAFVGRYPSRKLGRKAEFRTTVVAYIDSVVCVATSVRDVAPTPAFAEFDGSVDQAMDDLIATMALGREAVRQRNVSKYRDFNERLDTSPVLTGRIFDNMPR